MNNNQPQKNKITDILEKIKNNELVQKPKIYFRLKLVALIVLLLVVTVVSVLLSSFILFSLNVSGHASLIHFGMTGWQAFLVFFPWELALFEIILLVLLEYLLRSFRFGYKIPILYLFLGVMALMIVSGAVVEQTPLHSRILERADQEHLPPPLGVLYENTRRPPARDSGIFRGTIETIEDSLLIVSLDNPRGRGTTTPVTVRIPQGQALEELIVGDRVFIRGRLEEESIKAIQIKKANGHLPPPPHMR